MSFACCLKLISTSSDFIVKNKYYSKNRRLTTNVILSAQKLLSHVTISNKKEVLK